MKIIFVLLTVVYSSVFSPVVHDVPLALFHIAESDASLKINITFDLEDFSKSLEIKAEEVSLEKMQNYLNEHTRFQFNTQVVDLKVSEVKIVRDHIRVKGDFGKIKQKIERLKVKNTCLNNVSRHSNVIQVDLNNKTKDYRMHKKRTEIKVEY